MDDNKKIETTMTDGFAAFCAAQDAKRAIEKANKPKKTRKPAEVLDPAILALTADDMKKLLADAEMARAMYRAGAIDRDECLLRIKPYAEAFNVKAKVIAKKYNRKAEVFNVFSFLR